MNTEGEGEVGTEGDGTIETHTLPYVKQMCAQLLTHVRLFATPWTVARQAPLSMGFSRPEDWNGLSLPSAVIKPTSPKVPALQEDSLSLSHQGSPSAHWLL